MELRTQVKTLNFIKKFLLGETDNILPFTATPQKGPCPVYNGIRLERCPPERMGISSSNIEAYLKRIAEHSNASAHSIIIARKGKIVTEASFAPYSTARWHATHSMCKSVTGTAVGMLCDDGVLSLSEKVCDIFSDKCTILTGRRMRQITVEHLLTMSSGVQFKELGAVIESDWVRAFLESDVSFDPGTKFDYNSMNSYILSAIVSRKTGVTLYNFLRVRLFEPLGFGPVVWETCPLGITKGGWGMYVFLEDLVKLGQLYMQNGVWKNTRYLSADWINKAVMPLNVRDSGEEYGYHVWANGKMNAFMFNGMFGQFVAVFPQKELIIAVNSGNGHLFTQGFPYSAICDFCNTISSDSELGNNYAALESLNKFILTLCTVKDAYAPEKTENFFRKLFSKNAPLPKLPQKALDLVGKSYTLKKNRTGLLPIILQCICDSYAQGVSSILFERSADKLYLVWSEGSSIVRIPLCFTKPTDGQINLNGHIWDIGTTAVFKKDEDDTDILKISVSFLESSSTRLIKIVFEENNILLKLDESPAIALAMEKVHTEQVMLKTIDPAFFKDIDFLEYQFNRICAPTIKGTAMWL